MQRSVAIDAVTSRDLRYYCVSGDGLRQARNRATRRQRFRRCKAGIGCVRLARGAISASGPAPVSAFATERPGEPIACSGCGESKWVAEYLAAMREDVRLVRDADGRTRVDEWLGETERRDDAKTDEECYRCLECGEVLPAEPERNNHPTVLLDRITGIVNRGGWNLDTLAVIADVLREGGFGIREAEKDSTE